MAAAEIRAATGEAVTQAALLIRQGGIVAFPTETYYGLAADPFNENALARLFAAKARPCNKPILTLIDSEAQLLQLARAVPEPFRPLMARFWPGPLTLIFEARPDLPALLTAGSGTIGIRISSHPVARNLVRAVGAPITATSANLTGRRPAETAAEAASQLGGHLGLILDGGKALGGRPSTLLAERNGQLVMLRRGLIAAGEISAASPGTPLIEPP